MNKLIANSDNQHDLTKHLQGTMLMAVYAAKQMGIVDKELLDIIGISAFLHDAGKCTKFFQKATLVNDYSDANITSIYQERGKTYPRHNEISWLFASYHARHRSFKRVGLQAIYWHHGTLLTSSNIETRTTNTIAKELFEFGSSEIDNIFATIKDMIASVDFGDINPSNYLNLEDEYDDEVKSISMLFVDDVSKNDIDNAKRIIVRNFVIFADHIISNLTSKELDELIIDVSKFYPIKGKLNQHSFSCPNGFDSERFESQKQIVKDCDRTTVIKAPAGFGKSIIGLMWALEQGEQIYWVCPRNAVAEGVFDTLTKNLDNLNVQVSIELFLTSERKRSKNASNIPEGKCDIIVTNIDNFLSPMVNQKASNRLFDITDRNVVMDEFHELVTEEGMFSALVVFMKARNILANKCKTLLLSATPSIIHQFWDSDNNRTKVLPDNDNHYPAQHEEPYIVEFGTEFVSSPEQNTLTMYSAIKTVQHYYNPDIHTHIIHGDYTESDKSNQLNNILQIFGRNGSRNGTVISAPILQAALDISFNGLNKTSESPESDIQTIGRINRWGDNITCRLNFLQFNSDSGQYYRSESSAISKRYNTKLSKLWFEELSKITSPATLNDLYVLYNSFNNKYNKEIMKFLREQYESSIKKLSEFYPKQNKTSNTNKVISTKTLRSSKNGFFVVVKDTNDNWCCEPFNLNLHYRELENLRIDNRSKIESSRIKTIIDNLEDDGFDYTELKDEFFGKKRKTLTIERFETFAKCSESPLPIFTMKYDIVRGLIKN